MLNATGPPRTLGPRKEMEVDQATKRSAQEKDLEAIKKKEEET